MTDIANLIFYTVNVIEVCELPFLCILRWFSHLDCSRRSGSSRNYHSGVFHVLTIPMFEQRILANSSTRELPTTYTVFQATCLKTLLNTF